MNNFIIQIGQTQISGMGVLIFLGLVLLFFILTVIILIFLSKRVFRKIYRYLTSFKQVVLLVQMPKFETGEGAEKSLQPKSQEELAEKIAIMESFFSNIAGLTSQKGIKHFFAGRNDQLSFEIVFKGGLIYFYVVAPENLKNFMEEQITAQFPKALVEEVEDYNIFDPQGVVVGSMLKFKKEYLYPIKTYRQLESDSLNSITNALSKLDDKTGAAIQVLVRSAHPIWHKWGQNAASLAYQGKKVKQAIRESGSGFSWQRISESLSGWKLAAGEKIKEEEKTYQLSDMEKEIIKGVEEKAAKGGVDVNIRVIVSAPDQVKAKSYLDNILNSFAQFNIYEYGNAFTRYTPKKEKLVTDFIFREFDENSKMIMNTEEVASVFHFPLGHTETPNIVWLIAKKAAPPTDLPKEGLLLGYNDYRGKYQEVRITDDDRRRHVYIIGQTGAGKSVAQLNMALQDIREGKGVCFIDPHGEAVEELLQWVPKERAEDVIYFNPADTARPMGLNMLDFDIKKPEQKTFVINEMMNIFDKLYDLKATGGPMFEQYMRNAMLLILEDPGSGSTLMETPKVLSDAEFRKYKLSKTKTQVVKDFWLKEAEKAGGEAALQNVVPYITSKLTSFIANDIMRPIIAQQKSAFNFRQAMDEQKIILVNLSKGLIGDVNANLLGMIIIGKILMASLGRADISPEERKDFYLYIDEFQNFLTEGIQIILSEARKYKLCLTIAHQFIGQLVKNNDTQIRDAVFGNVGTKIVFRVGVEDTDVLVKDFAPIFNEYDLMNAPNLSAYIKTLIRGKTVPGFSMKLMPFDWRPQKNPELAEAIKELSRLKYGRDRDIVEAEITARSKVGTSRDFLEEAKQSGESEDIFA